MPLPLQDEPESTIGRKPMKPPEEPELRPPEHVRSGAGLRAEEGDESEHAGEIRSREPYEPPPVEGLEE